VDGGIATAISKAKFTGAHQRESGFASEFTERRLLEAARMSARSQVVEYRILIMYKSGRLGNILRQVSNVDLCSETRFFADRSGWRWVNKLTAFSLSALSLHSFSRAR